MTSQNSELGGRIADADGQSCGARQLAELRWYWDGAYVIDCRDGAWTARFNDAMAVLSAASADDLHALVWMDYSRRTSIASPYAARTDDARRGPGERALRRLREDGII
jgi:hypothetical protein